MEVQETATQPFVPLAQRGPDVKTRPLTLMDIGEAAIAIQDLLFESMGEITPEQEEALDDLLSRGADVLAAIKSSGELADTTVASLKKLIEDFKDTVEYIKM